MKKSVCSLILFTVLISESGISEINSDYSKVYQFPNPETTYLSDKLTQLDNGLLVKTGIRNSSIPFVEVYASNGLPFAKWELPFDKEISDCLFPMAAACGNEVCLFLNDKLEFFLPDGEYLRTEKLVHSIVSGPSRKILDMNFDKKLNQLHFLVEYDWQDPLIWYVYSTNGTLLASVPWTQTTITDSVFLTYIDNEVLLGNMLNGLISLYHIDGSPFDDYQIYEILNKIYDSLKVLYGEEIDVCITDIEFAESNIWIQSNKGMLCFDFNGIMLHAPLPFDSELNCNASGRLNDDTFFCLINDNDFVTFYASGAQAGRCFIRKYIKSCDKLISIEQDSSNNWWVFYQEFSGSFTQSFLSKVSAEGVELNKWDINNEEVPAAFACDYQNPIALVGEKNVYPLTLFNASVENFLPWPHNITSNSNDKIAAAGDKNGLIYLVNSSAKGNVHVFDLTGSYVRTYEVNASSLFPSTNGSVTALISKQNFRFYLRNLYEDGSVSVRYQIKNNDNWNEEPASLIQLESGIIVVGLKNKIAFCASVQKNKIYLSDNLEINVSPRGTPLAVDYKPEFNILSLYGLDWQRKSPGTLYKKLARWGKKLSKKAGDFHLRKKIYRKIFNYINKEKSKVNLVLKNTGNSQPLLNVNTYLAAKHIKIHGINLESLTAKTGEKPVSLGKLTLSKDSNCKVDCARLKKISVKGSFSGNVKTWFGDIDSINIHGQINKASFLSRRNIRKLTSGEKISSSIVRAGISPFGFSGLLGDIRSVKPGGDIELSSFIACAEEGKTPGWGNDAFQEKERFEGSILSVRSKMISIGNKLLPAGESRDSLFVTKNPINFLIQKKEGTIIIVNGKKQ